MTKSYNLFGTDGIRGRANLFPITPDIAMKIGITVGHILSGTGENATKKVIIAKDTRLSGYMIEAALMSGFLAAGVDVLLVGPMPTPAISMLVQSMRADVGVMISASHNPYYDNGLKIFCNKGVKLDTTMQEELEEMINQDLSAFMVDSANLGRAKRLDDAPGRYIEYAKHFFPKKLNLDGMKIVIDCANGASYHLAPIIFQELGAEIIKIGCSPNGVNINLDCGSMHPETLSQAVLENKADLGIALDGDADRAVFCDRNGKIIAGDHILGAIAKHLHSQGELKNNAVVITKVSNTGLEKYLESHGIQVIKSNVGDRHVYAKMKEHHCNFGGENSGHIIYYSDFGSSTGDGIVASLKLLGYLRAENIDLVALHNLFPLYPQKTYNYPIINSKSLDADDISQSVMSQIALYPNASYLIRKSGTESLLRVMVEAKDQEIVENIFSIIAAEIDKRLK